MRVAGGGGSGVRPGPKPIDELRRTLHHPDPAQLWFQLREIVEEQTYLRHGVTVDPGDVVLDVGANVGVAGAFFASVCGASAVHCFEPVAPLSDLLRENLRSFPACIVHDYGLSSEARRAPITYYPQATAMSSLYADPVRDRELVRVCLLNQGSSADDADAILATRYEPVALSCELRTLSSVVREQGLECIDVLKIDVEKAELDVLNGIEEGDWNLIRQVVVEVHDRRSHAAVIQVLGHRGFRVAVEQEPAMAGTQVRVLYATRR